MKYIPLAISILYMTTMCSCTVPVLYPQLWFDPSVNHFKRYGSHGLMVEAYDLAELDASSIQTLHLPSGCYDPKKVGDLRTKVVRTSSDRKISLLILKCYGSYEHNSGQPKCPDIHHKIQSFYSVEGSTMKIMICGEGIQSSHYTSISKLEVMVPEGIEVILDDNLSLSKLSPQYDFTPGISEPDSDAWQPCPEKPTRLRSFAEQEKGGTCWFQRYG